MRKRKRLIALALLISAAGLIIFVLLRKEPPEPVYRGSPLRAWLMEFDHGYSTTNYAAAQAAIRAMGTNTLPFLIRYLEKKDPPFHQQILRLQIQLGWRDPVDYATDWHRRAAIACGSLGVDGAPAFAAMQGAMNYKHASSDIAAALSWMFPKSGPVLTNILATGNARARPRAADALNTAFSHPEIEEMGRTALINALRDPDRATRSAAASALQFWNKNLEVVVPALTRALSDPEPGVRGNAASALGNMGSAAKPAVPELMKLLQDTNAYPGPNRTVSQRAMDVLKKIDPEAAAKAAGQ